jgi:hypothetical protein
MEVNERRIRDFFFLKMKKSFSGVKRSNGQEFKPFFGKWFWFKTILEKFRLLVGLLFLKTTHCNFSIKTRFNLRCQIGASH